jgi:hypothetical protein
VERQGDIKPSRHAAKFRQLDVPKWQVQGFFGRSNGVTDGYARWIPEHDSDVRRAVDEYLADVLPPEPVEEVIDSAEKELQCRFNWRNNSIAMWDNRCTVHYAVRDYTEAREVHRVTVLGDTFS